MLAGIAHRGPDGEGIWDRARRLVALGHRRLSIIDVAGRRAADGSADGRVVISLQRRDLQLPASCAPSWRPGPPLPDAQRHRGHPRSSSSNRASRVVDQLRGMFAFALWDAENAAVLARDRLGIKPLYYAVRRRHRVRVRAVGAARARRARRELPTQGLRRTSSRTTSPAAGDLRKAAQARARPSIICRMAPRSAPRLLEMAAPVPARQADGVWRPGCADSGVSSKDGLVADVPVGVFLSAAWIPPRVATAAVAAGGRMKAFSIGFDERHLRRVQATRAWLPSGSTSSRISETLHERNLLDVMDDGAGSHRRAAGGSFVHPDVSLSRLAARHVKVVLGGDGGDELWGGYPTYRAHRLAPFTRGPRLAPRAIVDRTVGRCRSTIATRAWSGSCAGFLRWDDARVERHLRWMSSVDLPELGRACWRRGDSPATLRRRCRGGRLAPPDPGAGFHDLHARLGADQGQSRPRWHMAWRCARRCSTTRCWSVSFALPSRYKVRRGSGKYLLKLAARGKIPDEIIDRPKKGFGIPLATWLRGPLKDRIHGGRRALARPRPRHPRRRRLPRLERPAPGEARRPQQAAVGAARSGPLVPPQLI